MLAWSSWIEVTLAFVLLDFWMYVWHRANHRVPFLWRFHRMHHSDPQMDASTGARFHPGEILLGGLAGLVVIPVLGIALWQLVIYEAVLFCVVLLHHSNLRLPTWLDHGLLVLVVTPAMHRVHHSRLHAERDSNYGSVLPYWDLLLGSFRLRTDARTIEIGLDGFDDPRLQGFTGLLRTPFRNQ
jgi:sterol desaturase/sphingolipid hydroxylase (fatty acid hydroxylase superfamily)